MEWRIKGYDSLKEILDQRVPLNGNDEAKIAALLKSLASKHLNAAEIAAGMADVRKDDSGGNRIILSAGQNPHYVAGLFRSDENDDD